MHVDFLIITALKDELDALLALRTEWKPHKDQYGFDYHHLRLTNHDGELVSVAAAWSGAMGESAAATRATALVTELQPLGLGMCGICAGKPSDTSLGDVIVADRVYSYDHGKLIARTSAGGERVEDFFHDITTYSLPIAWKFGAAALGADFEGRSDVSSARPLTIALQRTWLLRALHAHTENGGVTPYDSPERPTACPDWAKAIASLEKAGLANVKGGTIVLTPAGTSWVRDHRVRNPEWSPANAQFKVHTSAIATGKTVREDPELFDRLARVVRKTTGVEMEAAAIGYVGQYANIPTIVVKAVSDHADGDKDDSYRAFACTVAAQFLLAFVDTHVGPGDGSLPSRLGSSTKQWRNDVKDDLRGVRLAREKAAKALRTGHAENRTLVVLGESGAGKSALVKTALPEAADVLAVYADDIAEFEETDTVAFLEARAGPTTLVIDAAERLADETQCRKVARFIRAMHLERDDTPWRLVMVCQTLHWRAIKERLERTKFSWGPRLLEFESPPLTRDELRAVAAAFPSLGGLLGRDDLQPLTTQMKALDLLCDAAAEGVLPAAEPWVGESDFIDWYWEHYFRRDGRGDNHAVALQILARDQADEYRFGTALASVRSSDVALIPALVTAGVLTRREDVVRFEHDVYADYARVRYLLSELRVQRLDGLRLRITNPLWSRAFRLLSLHLLESHGNDVTRAVNEWLRVSSVLSGTSAVAFDLFVDAIPFAVSPERLLEQLSQQLLEDEGRLLRRFLVRFLYVATLPHRAVLEALRDASREVRTQAEVRWRQPILRLWIPVLRWIVRHGPDIVANAPDELVAIAEPWLIIGRKFEKLPARDELAVLILDIAERITHSSRWRVPVEDAERLYTVVVAAGATASERFRKLVRRYAGLEVPPPSEPDDPENVPEHQRYLLQRIIPVVTVGPWEGGPVADSNDKFARAVLQDPASGWLVEFDADFAREVFTALLIKPPNERTFGDRHGRDYELRHPDFSFKPTSKFAPVGHLLETAPDLGLRLIEQLASLATEQWLEAVNEGRHPLHPPSADEAVLELDVDGQPRMYAGAGDPFNWHLTSSGGPKPLKAALMTFEQWLYDLVDTKKLDDALLRNILVSTKSAAILGVLLEIALLSPLTLLSSLEPLATSADMLWMARNRLHLTRDSFLPAIAPEAYEFARLRHRERDLLRVVTYLFAQRDLKWPAIDAMRQRWLEDVARSSATRRKEWLSVLAATFDPANWKTVTTAEGHEGLEFQPPSELVAKNEAELAELNSSILLQSIPFRCRRVIDGKEQLSSDQLLELLERVAAAAELDEHTTWSVGGLAGLRCAVATLALLKFSDWLKANVHWRELCIGWVHAALDANTDEMEQHTNHADVRDWTWDAFAAEVVPVLLAEATGDTSLRRAAVTFISLAHDVAVKKFFEAAASLLPSKTFDQLLHLATEFAATSRPSVPVPVVSKTFKEKAEAFVAGTLDGLPVGWAVRARGEELDDGYLILVFSWVGARLRSGESLEERVRVIVAALAERILTRLRRHEHEPADALVGPRRPASELLRPRPLEHLRGWLRALCRFFRALFGKATSSTTASRRRFSRRPHSYQRPLPYESDYLITRWLAWVIVHEPNAGRRRELWEQWMRLPLDCEYFIETFFDALYTTGLDNDAPFFADALLEIGLFARTEGWLQPENESASRVAISMIGRGGVYERWKEAHGPIARRCWELWRLWIDAAHTWHGCLTVFCGLLCTPAFSPLRIEALLCIARYDIRQTLRDSEAQEAVTRLLETVTTEHAPEVAANASVRRSVELILEALVAIGSRRAIVLSDKLRFVVGSKT
jgi:nucleoside phosphorylase